VFFNGSVGREGPAAPAASLVLHGAHDARSSPVDGDRVGVRGGRQVLLRFILVVYLGLTGVAEEVLDLVSS